MDLLKLLESHSQLQVRVTRSRQEIDRVRSKFQEIDGDSVAIFCAGSLAREEIGENSDLDLFFLGADDEDPTELFKYQFFGKVIRLNEKLAYPEFSNDGRFLKIQSKKELIDRTGTPIDDSENLFTTRMLLLLESKWILGDEKYHEILKAVVSHYYRDSRGKNDFKPLFIINDLLRYWRTLCLNYEQRRNDSSKPWRKKTSIFAFPE